MSVVETGPPPPRPCHLLAIDTATERSCLALVTPQQVLSIDAEGGAQASTTLLPDVHRLLDQAGCKLAELDAIAFGCGPGAFTGLRTACSVTQGLAAGADKPVLPVDDLMLVAEASREAILALGADSVWVVQDARMDEIYGAQYRWEGQRSGRWQTLSAPALYSIEALNQLWAKAAWAFGRRIGSVAVVGSALSVMGDRLQAGDAPRLPAAEVGARARALGTLAISHWDDGVLLDAALAVPLYLRDKVALTMVEREAERAAKSGE